MRGTKQIRVALTAHVEEFQEEVFIIWVAIAVPPQCLDSLVDSFDLSRRYPVCCMSDDSFEMLIH